MARRLSSEDQSRACDAASGALRRPSAPRSQHQLGALSTRKLRRTALQARRQALMKPDARVSPSGMRRPPLQMNSLNGMRVRARTKLSIRMFAISRKRGKKHDPCRIRNRRNGQGRKQREDSGRVLGPPKLRVQWPSPCTQATLRFLASRRHELPPLRPGRQRRIPCVSRDCSSLRPFRVASAASRALRIASIRARSSDRRRPRRGCRGSSGNCPCCAGLRSRVSP